MTHLTSAAINTNTVSNHPPATPRCGLNKTRICCKESGTGHPAHRCGAENTSSWQDRPHAVTPPAATGPSSSNHTGRANSSLGSGRDHHHCTSAASQPSPGPASRARCNTVVVAASRSRPLSTSCRTGTVATVGRGRSPVYRLPKASACPLGPGRGRPRSSRRTGRSALLGEPTALASGHADLAIRVGR